MITVMIAMLYIALGVFCLGFLIGLFVNEDIGKMLISISLLILVAEIFLITIELLKALNRVGGEL